MRSLNVLLEVGDKWVTSDHYVPAVFQCREETGQAAK